VPLKDLVGRPVKCPRPGCGATARVEPGRNPMTAIGSTVAPPPAFACFPPWALRYEYPGLARPWHRPMYLVMCPRCGTTSYPAEATAEPIEPEET
jgi:hypothetical protein